jgi:hypothetical protein
MASFIRTGAEYSDCCVKERRERVRSVKASLGDE